MENITVTFNGVPFNNVQYEFINQEQNGLHITSNFALHFNTQNEANEFITKLNNDLALSPNARLLLTFDDEQKQTVPINAYDITTDESAVIIKTPIRMLQG